MNLRPDPLVGRTIAGKFLIESLLGGGGMGAVYKARHLLLDKIVAVKVMHDETAANASFAARFRREAKAASRLDHPNSIHVIDFGEDVDGLLYIAMEYLDGTDLHRTIERDWPLSDERTVDILSQVLAALAVAHEMKIVHRDLKPENIMILSRTDDEGRPHDVVKVCDFGIAKMTETIPPPAPGAPRGSPGRALTTRGVVVGTPEYMAPEQCRGETPDARTDLYAVGVILYQLLAGRIPFQADNAIDLVLKHVAEEPVPPTKINARASWKLEAVCLKALEKKPEKRYASAREMRAELRAAIGGADTGRVAQVSSSSGPGHSAQMSVAETLPALAAVPVAQPRRARAVVALAVLVVGGATAVLAFRLRGEPTHAFVGDPSVVAAPSPSASVIPPVDPPASVTSANPPAPVAPLSAVLPVTSAPKAPDKPTLVASAPPAALADPTPAAAVSQGAPSSTAVSPPSSVPPGAPSIAIDPPPSPIAPTPPAPFDPSKGRVLWSVSGAGGGATTTNVARALSHAASGWIACYQAGLRARGARAEGTATLRLTCDEEGRVIGATFSGFDLPDVAACIRRASMGATIPNVDTGAAWATIALTFQVAK